MNSSASSRVPADAGCASPNRRPVESAEYACPCAVGCGAAYPPDDRVAVGTAQPRRTMGAGGRKRGGCRVLSYGGGRRLSDRGGRGRRAVCRVSAVYALCAAVWPYRVARWHKEPRASVVGACALGPGLVPKGRV